MKRVYKYLPPERETFLSDGLLRMTQPGDLNDPFEFQSFCPNIDSILNETRAKIDPSDVAAQMRLQEASSTSAKRKSILAYSMDLLSSANRDVGIVSFSKCWNNSAMWAHYAQRHEGFCVGFDRNHPLFQYSHPRMQAGSMDDVQYLALRPEINVVGQTVTFYDIVFKKSDVWEYEQEFRIVYALENADDQRPAPKESLTNLPLHFKRFHPSIIKEVLIGYNAKKTVCDNVLTFAKKHNIPAFKMQLSTTSFAMEREPIA